MRTQAITTEPRALTATQCRPAGLFTTAADQGRSAALDVCVASTTAAAARGETLCRRDLIVNGHTLEGQQIPDPRGIRYRPPGLDSRWAAAPNGQQMSAHVISHEHPIHRWKHEIQMALRVIHRVKKKKHRLYHCLSWRDVRNQITDGLGKWEQKAKTSKEDWKWQKRMTSHPLSGSNWRRSHLTVRTKAGACQSKDFETTSRPMAPCQEYQAGSEA